MRVSITVTRQHSGLLLSTVHGGRYVKKLFIGYTLAEAKAEFRAFVKAGG